jgi:hypothetical protein
MRIKIPSARVYEGGMDDVINLASAVKGYLPSNLRYLILLMDVGLLWEAIVIHDEARREKFEGVRLGKFDDRILLGCYYDREDVMRYKVEPRDQEKIDRYEELVAILPNTTMPKQFVPEEFSWKRVEEIGRKRRYFDYLGVQS